MTCSVSEDGLSGADAGPGGAEQAQLRGRALVPDGPGGVAEGHGGKGQPAQGEDVGTNRFVRSVI